MADNLQNIGVRAVVEGLSQYVSSLNTINSKTADVAKNTTNAAKSGDGFNKALSGITQQISGLSPQAAQATEALSGIGEAAGVTAATLGPLALVVAVIAAEVGGFLALAQRGAGFSELENGFVSLTAAVNEDANALLGKFRDATGGTITDMELLTDINRTLIGVSKEFGHQFGEALPGLMKTAKAVAEATGRDVMSVFDAIAESVKRGDTRMLRSIGIIVDQKKAYEEYAKSIGKTTAELTLQERQQAVLNAVQVQGKQITDNLGSSIESNADKQEKAGVTISNFLDKLSTTVQPIFGAILDGINAVLDALSSALSPVVSYIGAFVSLAVEGFSNAARPILEFIGRLINLPKIFGDASKNFFTGGAQMIGALAKGILDAANTYVFPAVLAIAQGIADFLVGLSPPPKGPLSLIDQGGANTMQAWITGFTGVSLDPVEQVASQVNQAMGSVATEGIDQVKTRLAQLDAALAPFQNRLKIVQSTFDALKPAQEAAFRAIDRQLNAAQQALANGDQNAAALVQQLDAQRAQLQSYVDTQQDAIDNAQIQLAFAQAQQAQERAILDIRQKQIGPTPAEKKAAKGAGGGGGAGETLEAAGAGFGKGGGFDLANIGAAKTDIVNAFNEGLGGTGPDSALGAAQANIGKIGDALGQIGQVDIGSKIREKLGGVFDPSKPGSILFDIGKWFKDMFDPSGTGNIITILAQLPIHIVQAMGDIGTKIAGKLVEIGPSALVALGKVQLTIVQWAIDLFNPALETSLTFKFIDFVKNGLPNALASLENTLITSLKKPFDDVLNSLAQSISQILFENIPNVSIKWYLDQMVGFFAALPGLIADGLSALGSKLSSSLITPIVAGADAVISGINQMIGNVFDGLKKTIHSIADNFKNVPGVADLLKGIDGITAPKIPLIAVPAAASGGLFGGGVFSANPREELIGASQQMAVFPHEFVQAVRGLTQVMTQIAPSMQAMINNNTTNINKSMNNTFNGVQDSGEAVRRLAVMRAYT